MKQIPYLFIERDGMIVDRRRTHLPEELSLFPDVFTTLCRLQAVGYKLVMLVRQEDDEEYSEALQMLLDSILASQEIKFAKVVQYTKNSNRIDLFLQYWREQNIDLQASCVVAAADITQTAENLGINHLITVESTMKNWQDIAHELLDKPRIANVTRNTNETSIHVMIDLDRANNIQINTGIGFFDHMLEQMIKHAGISAEINIIGDLQIDDHHTVEDTALALGEAIRIALGNKHGITRYGFLLPMDEALVEIALDLGGRAYCQFAVNFTVEKIGGLATEMISHFFYSLAESLCANLHITARGENNHHISESIFKGIGRTLRQAIVRSGNELPTTKGVL